MAKYKLIEVFKDASGKETQSIYDHTDKNVLMATMNNDFGARVKTDDVVSTYCIAIDNESGMKIDSCYWAMPVVNQDDTIIEVNTSIRPRVYTHNDYTSDNIAAYESEKLAIGNFHTKKAAAMNKADCNHAITILIDGKGDYLEFSNWTRPEL